MNSKRTATPLCGWIRSNGVDPTTVSTWHRDPLFAATLEDSRAERRRLVRTRLDAGCVDAAKALLDIVRADTSSLNPAGVRRQAAMDVLALAGVYRPTEAQIEESAAPMDDSELAAELADVMARRPRVPARV